MKIRTHIAHSWRAAILAGAIAALPALLSGCGPDGSSFRLSGTIEGMTESQLYIFNQSADHARLDTLNLREGQFLYRGESKQVTPYTLIFPNGLEQVIFVGPGEDLTYEASANDLKNFVVEGSEANGLMNRFRRDTRTANPSATAKTARAYVKANPTSPVAIYLFDRYFVQADQTASATLKALLKVLKKHHPHNRYLLDIESKVASAERCGVGKTLPNVTLMRRDRSTVSLWGEDGDTAKASSSSKDKKAASKAKKKRGAKSRKYNLVVFWSTWIPDGYDFMWRLRQCEEEYRPDSLLRVVAVSLDVERYKWENTTARDTLTAYIEHYCDGLAFESKAVKRLGISAIPFYLLTDSAHKVIASGTDPEKLKELLKKNVDVVK